MPPYGYHLAAIQLSSVRVVAHVSYLPAATPGLGAYFTDFLPFLLHIHHYKYISTMEL